MKAAERDDVREARRAGSVVEGRIQTTLAALARAYARHHAVRSPRGRTLLVFVGGEFMFRHADGPCTRDERDRVLAAFRDASTLYPDMLIMPGTIVSGERVATGHGSPIWLKVTNTAPTFGNGSLLHSVDKAGDAGTTGGVAPAFPGDDPAKAHAPGTGTSHFALGTLKVAVDICVDQVSKRAQTERRDGDLHGDRLGPVGHPGQARPGERAGLRGGAPTPAARARAPTARWVDARRTSPAPSAWMSTASRTPPWGSTRCATPRPTGGPSGRAARTWCRCSTGGGRCPCPRRGATRWSCGWWAAATRC